MAVSGNSTERQIELNNWRNPQNRFLLEKVIVTQTRNYWKVHYLFDKNTPLVPTLIQINPAPFPLIFVLILSSYLRLGVPSGLFPSRFDNKTLYGLLQTGLTVLNPLVCFLFKVCMYYCVIYMKIFWLFRNMEGLCGHDVCNVTRNKYLDITGSWTPVTSVYVVLGLPRSCKQKYRTIF